MNIIKIWVEFEHIKSIAQISHKANIKLTIEGDMKKVDIVSQLDLKSGYVLELDEYGEYCISLEHEDFKFSENFSIEKGIKDIEISIE